MKKIYVLILFVTTILGCTNLYETKRKLQEIGIRDIDISIDAYKYNVLFYVEPSIVEIIASLDLPPVNGKVTLHYVLHIDLQSKSLLFVSADDFCNSDADPNNVKEEIRFAIFKQVKIKTKGNHIFNTPTRNIRNERNMEYLSVSVKIEGDTIKVNHIPIINGEIQSL